MAAVGDSARITPTAHYTAQVWVRAGLSDPALGTTFGAALHTALSPVNEGYERVSGRPGLDAMLLARHRALDGLLERDIAAGMIGQVVEIAAGLSGRGCRFTRRFPDLRYVETDLPHMAAHKRRVLDAAGLRGPRHEVRPLDALAGDGPDSLATVAAELDPTCGLAIVTEGLLSYLPRDAVLGLWQRTAATLGRFPHGLYLSDLHLSEDVAGLWFAEVFRVGLELFARGAVRHHFASADETENALRTAGFRAARVYRPREVVASTDAGGGVEHLIRVVAATT